MHLHNEERDEKVEDFTPDDVSVYPDDPMRTRDLFQTVYPAVHHTEGVVESPEGTALLGGGQAAERKAPKRFGLIKSFFPSLCSSACDANAFQYLQAE